MKRAFSFFLAIVLCIMMVTHPGVFYNVNAENYTSSQLSGINNGIISNESASNYVNAAMKYYLRENSRVKSNLDNNSAVVFFFDGCSDNVFSSSFDHTSNHMSSYVAVVKLRNGNPTIIYENENSSTIPDNPRMVNNTTAGNSGTDVPTVLDGIHNISSVNHQGKYAALHIHDANSSVNVIRCNSNRYYADTSSGINAHARGWDYVSTSTYSSTGCFNIGVTSPSTEYNDFMYAVTGISNARSNKFSSTGIDMGIVIVDRYMYKSTLEDIYDSHDLVEDITAYSTALAPTILSNNRVTVNEGVYVFHCVRNPERVLDIQSDSKERGANIQLYNNWYNQVQKFRVVNMGDYYCIQSVYSGMWLDIASKDGSYSVDGCNIQLWDTNTSTEQKWVFEDAGNGNVYIRSLYGMYVDTGGPTDNSTNIQTYHFDGSTSQQWHLELTSPYGRKDVADGIYTFHNVRNSARVIDIQGDSQEDRANIQLYDDLNNDVQKFRVTKVLDDTNSFYYLIQSVYSGYWLDIAGTDGASGNNIQLFSVNSNKEEHWSFEDAGNGKVLIRNFYGTYVDLDLGKTENSTNIQAWNYDGSTSMEWVMHKVYTISFDANGGTEAPAQQSKQSDINVTLSSAKPTRTGYTFSGWNTKADGSGTNYATGATYTDNADITLYAQWTANTYTVNINANGGITNTSSLSINYDTKCNLSPDFVQRNGYELTGWNLYRPADNKWFVGGKGWYSEAEINANGYTKLQYVPNLSMALDSTWFGNCGVAVSEFEFYAVWNANTYAVKFNGNGATSGNMSDQTFTYDVVQNLTANAFRRAYTVTYSYNGATGVNSVSTATATSTFNGWATSANGAKVYNDKAGVKNLTTSGTCNLYANWTLGTVTLPTPTKTGYTFGGWYTDSALTVSAGAAGASYKPTANVTLYAKWVEASLTKISIKTLPTKTSYYAGDTLNTAGLTLTATYSDESTKTISSGFTCTPTSLNTAGTQTITVSYSGKITTFNVTVNTDSVNSIAIKTKPTKTNYFVGDTFDTAGLTLTATFSSGKTETVTSGFTCSPTALNTAGTQTITVTYSGKSTTFDVTVNTDSIERVAVKTNPTKTSYYAGDTLDTAGLTLTATYNSGKTETVSSGFTCSPTTLNTAGTQAITVTYSGKTTTFNVTVSTDTVKSIAVKTQPTKTNYFVGDTLETADLTLTATYNSGKTETVSSGFTCTPTALNTAGTQTITVSYSDKSTTFDVTVNTDAVKSISVKTQPAKTNYFVGDTFDTAGLTLTATFSSGKTETVTSGFTCTPMTLNTAGMQTITVTYSGKTTTFNVTVNTDSIESVAVKTNPTKTSYYVGDTLNTACLTLTATYSSGKVETVSSGFTCTPTALNTAGMQTITVTYSGKTTTFNVTVSTDTVKSIAVKTQPTKTNYFVGDTLETADLTLTATYNSGKTETVSSGFTCTPTTLNTAGTQTITVTYSGKTTTFDVIVQQQVSSEELPHISLSQSTAKAGDRVDVTLSIENNPGIIATSINLTYDNTVLRLVDIKDGGLLGTSSFSPGKDYEAIPYTVIWEDGLATQNHTENGILATFTFEVQEGAPLGETTITLGYVKNSTINVDMTEVEFTTTNGVVTVTDRTPGDVNNDGVVDLKDVVILRRYLSGGWNVTIDEANSDVNGDSIVDLKDTVILRRYLSGGWNVTLL